MATVDQILAKAEELKSEQRNLDRLKAEKQINEDRAVKSSGEIAGKQATVNRLKGELKNLVNE